MGDEAGSPLLDEDYLVLSTIHSAKGQEWDVVYVLQAVDRCIPSDMAAGSPGVLQGGRWFLYLTLTQRRRNPLRPSRRLLYLLCRARLNIPSVARPTRSPS